MTISKKPDSLSSLIKEADEVFSKFVRTRDLPGGVGKCFVCGVKLFSSQAHNGHYIHRSEMPTRYDEDNCHAICVTCNCFTEEHQEQYALKMVLKYELQFVASLEQKARGLQKFTRPEIQDLIDVYKSKIQGYSLSRLSK